MLNIITTITKPRGIGQRIDLNIEELLEIYNHVDSLINKNKMKIDMVNPVQDIDLSKVEQGLLIRELCKRPGVCSLIGRLGDDYKASILKQNGEFVECREEEGVGPVNIMVITNERGEKEYGSR